MTAKKDETEAGLARERTARIRLAKRAIDFIRPICKDGERHTRDSFSFRVKKDPPLLGGNTAEIWYRGGLVPVFKTWWQFDIEKCHFEKFDSGQEWQRELLEIIERQGKAIVGAHKVVPVKRVRSKFEEEMY